ncbi:MAG TPA: TIGR00725 family protein [Candidatus Dormibacteraeota bacterium]|nr:TIGR00725 family protein [Candidatus Dormibacteraeota bacterium]
MPRRYVAVCGASEATQSQLDAAREVGKLLARNGAVVINGGYGGVMAAVSEGASSEGGTVVGILPENVRDGANPHLTIALPTGLGQIRNALIVTAADSVIAIGQGWGTLSEIAFARKLGRPVYALDTWDVKGLEGVASPAEAVRRALETN